MDENTATWVALHEALGARKGETLMAAAARVYSEPNLSRPLKVEEPRQAIAIAVLRSAGYGSAETWERLRRARALIPSLRVVS